MNLPNLPDIVMQKINQNSRWFKNLWDDNQDQYEFYKLAVKIKPNLTFAEFEKGWQYRVVLHPDYKQAKQEFMSVILGCY